MIILCYIFLAYFFAGFAMLGYQVLFNQGEVKIYKGVIACKVTSIYSDASYPFVVFYSVDENLDHEYGHVLQMAILSLFFLPVYVISIMIGNIFKIAHEDIWLEKWADKLGG